jgi:hypothetical protein
MNCLRSLFWDAQTLRVRRTCRGVFVQVWNGLLMHGRESNEVAIVDDRGSQASQLEEILCPASVFAATANGLSYSGC